MAQCEEGKSCLKREGWPRAAAEKPTKNARHTLVRMEAVGARLGRRVVPDGPSAENSL